MVNGKEITRLWWSWLYGWLLIQRKTLKQFWNLSGWLDYFWSICNEKKEGGGLSALFFTEGHQDAIGPRFGLKDLSIDEIVGAWCLAVVRPTAVYLLDFFCSGIQLYLLLSPYLCFISLFFISWFICSMRWCIDKLEVFHANQTSMCLDPHLN